MRQILIFSLLLVPLFGEGQDIYLFDQGGVLDYTIKLSDIEVGHSARQVSQGFLLGVAKSQRREFDMSKPVDELFKETIADNKKEADLLKQSEEDLAQKFKNLDDEYGVVNGQETDVKDETSSFIIQWKAFESCAKTHLPYLKQAVYLKGKAKTDPKAIDRYALVKGLALDQFSNGGLVCGAFLGPELQWAINDEITNIKILSALLAAKTPADKRYLFETLVAGYEQRAPEESRILFVYFWAKISFMTVMNQGPIPSTLRMVQEFKMNPETIQSEMILDGEVIQFETEVQYSDLKKQVSLGRQFVKGLELQYEK